MTLHSIPDHAAMAATEQRIISFTLGPFQATLFPLAAEEGKPPGFSIDLYHGGSTYTHPRFICTGEEMVTLTRLALAADTLVRDYLGKGKSFSDWCRANGVNPFKPELGI